MSAIVGIYYPDGRVVDCMDLDRMMATVAHRGLDGAGVWSEGSIGLGHRMLWTTPESLHEKLPLTDQASDLVITADARIDNRTELLTALGLLHRSSQPITDSHLILGAYEKWGERCPEKLLGDFAFVIWDGRKQALFCARDPMGVKPFYYYRSGRTFIFASEIKALLCLLEVPRRLNEVKVADHLVGMFDDRTITFYQEIFRLPAGYSMIVDHQGIRILPYWMLDPSRELRLRSDKEYAEAFREVFTEAVRCRLRSAFPVGSMLSGGLDSSSIVCTARNLLAKEAERPLHTFSAIFPSLPESDLRKIDERPFIDAVLALGGLEPHYVHADRLSPLTDLKRVFWHEDEAVLAPNLYMHWALYSAAHKQCIRVLLDGIDGDTTVSHGIEYLTDLARTGRWKTLVTEAAALSRKLPPSFPPWRIIWNYGLRPFVPETAVSIWQLLSGRTQPPWAVDTAINPVFARRIGLAERTQVLQGKRSITPRRARQMHWCGLTSALLSYALELADKAAAAFSLEPRYPFFDRRLMEFCLALPPAQKLHQGWTRMVMRRAMTGVLPPTVQWRSSKANLSPNFLRRLLDFDRKVLEQIIMEEPHAIESYVDITALRKIYHRYASQPLQRDRDALTVYGAVTLALWLGTVRLSS